MGKRAGGDAEGRPLPSVLYNPTTIVGSSIAGVSFGLILFLMLLESLTKEHKPYMGIITFVVLPIPLIIGLVLLVAGAWREHRRRGRGLPPSRQLPTIDLNDPRHRLAFILFSGGTLLFLFLSGFGSYKAYEYTDSDAFCGTICHQVMHPEYTAYQLSPHARVDCVDCHIGPGAEWFVRSKMSGAYQVYATVFDKYPRPIETPIKSLRPSRETCEQCHWPAQFYGENLVVHDYYLPDEKNSHWRLDLLMKIGGGNTESGPTSGIHWHMNIDNDVEYVALDRGRQKIPWVRATSREGKVTVYRSTEFDFSDEDLATAEIRQMDCIDCHNRPTHIYHPPAHLVNQALKLGRIDVSLPYAKSVAVDVLDAGYQTTGEAMEKIAAAIRSRYQKDYPEIAGTKKTQIDQMVTTVQRLYRQNYFPEMKANWRSFPNNIGHLNTLGCFRCHDGHHVTDDGTVLPRDCNVCHTILAQEMGPSEQRESLGGVQYHHPEDIDEAWKEMSCSECHGS